MTSRSDTIVIPVKSLDKVLYEIYSTSSEKGKHDMTRLGIAIFRMGKHIIKDKNNNDIEVYEIPKRWYRYIKEQYEMPI